MDNVGVVTFFKNNNYGSVLQCYALQQVLKQLGVQPVALNQQEIGFEWKIKRIGRILCLFISTIRYPDRVKSVYKSIEESKRSCTELSDKTRYSFDIFIEKNITYKNQSFSELKKAKDYSFFISGSDQVWGTSGYFLNPFMFLRFAEKNKRYSYAASFGADECPVWFEKKLRKYISEYKKISVREQTGLDTVKSFGLEARIDIDPTMLLEASEWRKISTNHEYSKTIFAYFLNEPSDIAIEHINRIIERNNIEKVIASPYKFNNLERIHSRVEYRSISPDEFLGLIDSSEVVCTDSFHGAVFSIIFCKEFYSYYRKYTHNSPQNNRIETLLKHYMLQDQLIINSGVFSEPNYSQIESLLQNDRIKAIEYLSEVIGENR